MKSEEKLKQLVFVFNEHNNEECLIGNSNTGRLHSLDCSAIDMMREDHKIPTDGEGFTPCGWCHACGKTSHLNTFQDKSKDPKGTEICRDKKVIQLFNQTGCLSCKSKKGIVKMYPNIHGVRLIGRNGHWWIYLECECGYQTAWWKAKNKLKNER